MTIDRITVQDAVDAGYCVTGLREWFRVRAGDLPPGLDLREFVRSGLPIETARALNDGLVDRIIEMKESRRGE